MGLKHNQSGEKMLEDMQKMMRIFTHDLRNPLLNMQALVQEVDLSCRKTNNLDEDLVETLGMLKETTNQMDNLIVGTNELYHCMFDELECEQVDMHEMFLRCFAKLKLAEEGIELISSGMPSVFADPLVVHRVVCELLSNAKKAIAANSQISLRRIKVYAVTDDHSIKFLVEDSGCGFEDYEQDRAFEPFFSGKKFLSGAGMGLARVKAWVEHHGGQVEINNLSEYGACVQFSLSKG